MFLLCVDVRVFLVYCIKMTVILTVAFICSSTSSPVPARDGPGGRPAPLPPAVSPGPSRPSPLLLRPVLLRASGATSRRRRSSSEKLTDAVKDRGHSPKTMSLRRRHCCTTVPRQRKEKSVYTRARRRVAPKRRTQT